MTEPRRDDERSRLTPRVVLSVVLLVAVAAFAIDNRQRVRVGYVFDEGSTPLIVVILVVFVIGGFVGYVAGRRR